MHFFTHNAVHKSALFGALLLTCSMLACSKDSGDDPTPDPTPTPTIEYLKFQTSTAQGLTISKTDDNEYKIITTDTDPYVLCRAFEKTLNADSTVLTFQYKSTASIDKLQLFLGAPVTEVRSKTVAMPVSKAAWKTFSVNLTSEIKKFAWGKPGTYLRMDFGQKAGVTINIRNIYFRAMTEAEKKAYEESEKGETPQTDAQFEEALQKYVGANYISKVTNVKVQQYLITISGNYTGTGDFAIAEVSPYQDITKIKKFTNVTPLKSSPFSVSVNRTIERDGFTYDRILSKWAIIKVGDQSDEVVGYGRYADNVNSSESLNDMKPATKKGLGGYFLNGIESDLDDLGITSVTINIPITGFMRLTNTGSTYAHTYGGKTYYFDKSYIDNMDATLKTCMKRNIVVSAIILVQNKNQAADAGVGALLQHPNYTAKGNFTMPNMTTAASVNCYAAALDFLASRYCKTGSPNGRIHKWIMHNEVDIASDWTNMGDNRPITIFADTYIKSMRICYNIAHKYDPNADVLASFSHFWTQVADYSGLALLKLIVHYSNNEGDFHWGVAWHCYAQDLNNPRTWLDSQATFSMKTPIISFKNLEVIDKWIKQSANLYKGTTKRSLWLSENGTNSPSYSQTDLALQAAGFAYGWQKIKALDGIDGIQWHNWIDNRGEYGLRIGLRRFPNDEEDPLGKKAVWYAYQAAGTANESSVFEPYLKVIGIPNWDIVQHNIAE